MSTVLESFVGFYLLNKLAAFIENKIVMILGVKDELKKLERRMRHIGAYLKDAERMRITNESVSSWLKELKDVMYDADDMIDFWIYKNQSLPWDEPSSLSNSPTCCSFPLFSCFRSISVRHEVAQQIKTLNDRLEYIFREMRNLNLQKIQSEAREVSGSYFRVSSPVIEVDVVGNEIEESARKLVKLAITDAKQKFNIIAITGMGGIGKTTLAQRIYNDRTMKNRYFKKMWLSVSQNYSPAQLIKEAIRTAGGNHGNEERESELLPILANAISGKSFFLVLDDVWNPDPLVNSLLNALKSTATCGFILVTTRDQRVAMRMGAKDIHQIKVLSAKSAWELLCKKSYLTSAADIQHLHDVGTKIIEKCEGLPLAVIAIAGMLATKNKSKNEWENVVKSSAWSIRGLPDEIDRALYLSYEDLSPHLKQCFLYCSLYPSNYIIFRADLVRFWIAEGLVEDRSDQTMENTAEDYYNELIRRHLLEPYHLIVDHSRCKMHDLLRSLAGYLSKEESIAADQVLSDPNVISRLRRLSIKVTNEQIFISDPLSDLLKLGTFMIFNCQSKIEVDIFGRFKKLRVLYINEKGIHNIPESIGDLIHLRLLDLDHTSISNLPESVGCLTNLLFLSLSGCELLHTLPRGITRLHNLCQLKIDDTPLISVPKGLQGLQKLTKIWGFQAVSDSNHDGDQDGWDLQELEGLYQLRRIWIRKLERAKNPSSVFANKTHLKQLILDFSESLRSSSNSGEELDNCSAEELENENSRETLEKLYPPPCIEDLTINNYSGTMLPRWMSSFSLDDLLPNLQYLEFTRWSCCMDLPPLGLLPNLKYLRVMGASSIVRISSEFLGISIWNGPDFPIAFPKLEYLIFEDMSNWEEWVLPDFEGEKSASWQLMPCIRQLSIVKCPKLSALPEGLQQLKTIEDLVVRHSYHIRSIQNFQFECQILLVEDNQCLQILSDLPGVKWLKVYHMYNLRYVRKMDSVDHIKLINYKMEYLPEWLVTLMEERKKQSDYKLSLELFCSTALLQRCLKDGSDWPIISNFTSVSIYNEERTATLDYTREPESYYASLKYNPKDWFHHNSKANPACAQLKKTGRKTVQY